MAAADLTRQLLGNAPPPPPSFWPPAWPVWLIVLVTLTTALLAWRHWRRTKRRRRFLRALRRLKRRPAQSRLRLLHALLRNAGGVSMRQMSSVDFAQAVARTLGKTKPPAWVNAHYRRRTVRINWRDARRLIRRWCR